MFPFPAGDLSCSRPGGTKKGKGRNLSLFVASPRLEREFRLGNLVFIYSTSHIFSKLRIEPKNI